MKKHNAVYSVLFLSPAFILFTAFIIIPICFVIYYSMTKWNGMGSPVFIWFANYKKMFGSMEYWVVIKNSFALIAVSLFVQIPIGLIIAYMIYRTKRGVKFFRSVFFLPVVIAPTAIALMFSLFLNSNLGPVNIFLGKIGLESLQMSWLSDSKVVLWSVILPGIYQYIGFYVVIFLAALYGLPEEVFESASIDGASTMNMFFRIAIPMLKDVLGICAILGVTGSLKAFEHPYIMTWGGPGVQSTFLGLYIYKTAFTDFNFGYAGTIAVSVLFISILFTIFLRKMLMKTYSD